MLKYALLAGAVMISASALAQDKPTSAPTTQTPPAAPAQTAPVPATPEQMNDPALPNEPQTAEQATELEATPVTGEAQIAQVVDSEFPTYDKDANGALNTAEFSDWMVALRTASDPATDAASADTKTWIDQAFASADADQNKAVSKGELTAFLSKGAS